jgi:hypothetical protein
VVYAWKCPNQNTVCSISLNNGSVHYALTDLVSRSIGFRFQEDARLFSSTQLNARKLWDPSGLQYNANRMLLRLQGNAAQPSTSIRCTILELWSFNSKPCICLCGVSLWYLYLNIRFDRIQTNKKFNNRLLQYCQSSYHVAREVTLCVPVAWMLSELLPKIVVICSHSKHRLLP